MHIAIDGRYLLQPNGSGEGAGVGHYVLGIIRALMTQKSTHQFTIFVPSFDTPSRIREWLHATDPSVSLSIVPSPRIPFLSRHLVFSRQIAMVHPDLFFAPHGQLPLGYRGRSLVTIHDAAIYRHPEWFPDKGFGRWLSTQVIVPNSLKNASRIIAVSESTKRDLADCLKIAPDKVSVVYPAVDIGSFSEIQRDNIQDESVYFLTLGTLEPRKNFSLAVKAFERCLELHPEWKGKVTLRMVGKRGWKYEELIKNIEQVNKKYGDDSYLPIQEQGYVSAEEKMNLLRGATALLYPSLYEGFGMPVLEAMGQGMPVITTRLTSLPEVGGEAVLYVDSDDVQTMVEYMIRLVEDQVFRDEYRQRGLERSKLFSWEKTGKETIGLFEKRIF